MPPYVQSAVTTHGILFLLCTHLFMCGICGCEKSDETLFSACHDRMVHITSGNLKGTGFIAKDSNHEYIYTCEHCILGKKPIEIKLSSGRTITPYTVFFTDDRDLVRFDLQGLTCSGLSVSCSVSNKIGKEIVAVGDSLGMGVMTINSGKILGVGATKIEIDAVLQHGNSGGPIMTRDGCVVGVVFSGERYRDEFTVGTRFDDFRYFGVRIDNVQWKSLPYEDYRRLYSKILSMRAKCSLMKIYLHKIAKLTFSSVKSDGSINFAGAADLNEVPTKERETYDDDKLVDAYNQIIMEYRAVHNGKCDLVFYDRGLLCKYKGIEDHREALNQFKHDLHEKEESLKDLVPQFNEMCITECEAMIKELEGTDVQYCGMRSAVLDLTKTLLAEFKSVSHDR